MESGAPTPLLQLDVSATRGLLLTFAAHVELEIARSHDHGVRSISVLFTREAERCLAVDK
jgi:hypothetical protein